MKRVHWFMLLLAGLTALASAHANLRGSAFHARALLGPETWARVIKIKNTRPTPQFPATVFAVVFELEGRLWFYTGSSGTESLSDQPVRLEEDKTDFGALLQAIHPGFTRYKIINVDEEMMDRKLPCDLPHGCFIESLARLRKLQEGGQRIEDARLLAFYTDERFGGRGHTVLYFERVGQRYYVDSAISSMPTSISENVGGDALSNAQTIKTTREYPPPVRARFLPLDNFLGHQPSSKTGRIANL